MKDVIYVLFDTIIYFVQGLLFVMMLKGAKGRFSWKNRYSQSAILLLQYVAVQMFLHESGWIKRIFYGDSMGIHNSRQSIILVLFSMAVTLVVSVLVLKEKRMKIVYYVVTFYSIMELIKFAFYPFSLWLLDRLMQINTYLYADRQIYGQETFYMAVSGIEIFWNVLLNTAILYAAYKMIQRIKKYLDMSETYQQAEIIFLLFPSVIGLLLCLMIRSMMFWVDGKDMNLLLSSRPEMNFLIPCTSLLCVVLILLAAKMLRKLREESNRKIEISVYQDRIREMEQHMEDVENLYVGIRGMKHDMKNYIADMDALMKQETDQAVLKQYLDSLQASVEQLDMKYNTGNPVTDVILQRYDKLAEKNGIDFRADFIFPLHMGIDTFDLSIIINNALENALEACKRQVEGRKAIELYAYRRENMFFVIVKNSFDGKIVRNKADGRLLTTKADVGNHGLGLRNMELCAEKYFGKAETTIKEKEFELAVMLQKKTGC